MKAVVGSVAQSKRIQLAKAASSFARFAATADAGCSSGCGEQYAKAAYLRLASSAFDELVQMEAEGGVGVSEKAEKKKGKRGSGDDGMETGDQGVESNVKRLKTKM